MVTSLQAIATVRLHHVEDLFTQYGTGTTIDAILADMQDRVSNPTRQNYTYRCPKCNGKGVYAPGTDSETLPTQADIGLNYTSEHDISGGSPAKITCSICLGAGQTLGQVVGDQPKITYSNA